MNVLYFNFPLSNRCVAPDNRGYGYTEKPTGVKKYSVDYLTADIKNLIHGRKDIWHSKDTFFPSLSLM